MQQKSKETSHASVTCDDSTATEIENHSTSVCGSNSEKSSSPSHVSSKEGISNDQVNEAFGTLESINLAGSVSGGKGETLKDPEKERNSFVRKKSGSEEIIIPIILKMVEFDHKDKDNLLTNLKTIQGYLCSFKSRGLTVANISATMFPQTLDWLQSYLLQCIEQSSESNEDGRRTAEN